MRLLFLFLSLCVCAEKSNADTLTVLVDSSADMPFAKLEEDHVRGGIQFDLNRMMAHRLGHALHLKAVPRRRIGLLLREGQADWSCALLPEWLADPVDWTQAFLPHAGVVLARADAPMPKTLADLAGEPVGTIRGYVYPELEQALGRAFVREDAPNASAVLRMLELGRMSYASVNLQYLDYHRSLGRPALRLHPYLMLRAYETRCAVSRHSKVSAAQLDKVIDSMRADGSLKAIQDRYR